MRMMLVGGVVAAMVAAAGQGVGAHPSAHTGAAKVNKTLQIVRHPVTKNGHPGAGYTVKREQGEIDCSFADPSPGARSKNIEVCSPSAAYAIACWKAAAPHHALCLRDPHLNKLAKLKLSGHFARTGLAPRKQRAPLRLVLADGTHCMIRDGGAWGSLKSHPKWNATYSCDKHGDVWAAPKAAHWGVNESKPAWRVHTAKAGKGRVVVTRRVALAYFVKNAKH